MTSYFFSVQNIITATHSQWRTKWLQDFFQILCNTSSDHFQCRLAPFFSSLYSSDKSEQCVVFIFFLFHGFDSHTAETEKVFFVFVSVLLRLPENIYEKMWNFPNYSIESAFSILNFIQFLVDTLNVCKQFLLGSNAWTHLPSHTCQVWTLLHRTGSEWLHRTIAWWQVATRISSVTEARVWVSVCVCERGAAIVTQSNTFSRSSFVWLWTVRYVLSASCFKFTEPQSHQFAIVFCQRIFFLNYFSQDSIELFKNGCPKETGNYSRYFICKKYFFHREMSGCWKSTREQRVPHAFFWGYVDQSRCSSMKLLIFFFFGFRFIRILQKRALESTNARLALVMKSGKYCLGYNQTLKSLRQGKAKLIIIANNTPPLRWDRDEFWCEPECGYTHWLLRSRVFQKKKKNINSWHIIFNEEFWNHMESVWLRSMFSKFEPLRNMCDWNCRHSSHAHP